MLLVTGANGQLGNELRLLLGDRAVYVGREELDITDEAAVRRFLDAQNFDFIINCAAYTAVDKAEDDEAFADKLNHLAPGYLAAAAEEVGAALIQVSTDYVFDGTAHLPYTEEVAPCPNSAYGRTKLAGEEAVMQKCSRAMVIRTAWLYSIYGNNFVKTMIRLGKEREALGVVFDQIGTPTYANDLARAIMAAINQGVVPGIYHYSNEGVCSWYDFTRAIHRLAGITTCNVSPLHTHEYPAKAPRPNYSVLDKTKIKNTFNITIPHWEDSLQVCVNKLMEV